jgi:predicted acyl esterase
MRNPSVSLCRLGLRRHGILLVIALCLSVRGALAGGFMRLGGTGRDGATRTSFYLTMRDGVRIAVDLNLPESLKAGDRIPALVRQTRYYRSFDLGWRLRFVTRNWPVQKDLFLAHGYAWLDVDVRGTGASFGRWVHPWSPDEIRDGAEVVDWVIRQPWSNGKVGGVPAAEPASGGESRCA